MLPVQSVHRWNAHRTGACTSRAHSAATVRAALRILALCYKHAAWHAASFLMLARGLDVRSSEKSSSSTMLHAHWKRNGQVHKRCAGMSATRPYPTRSLT